MKKCLQCNEVFETEENVCPFCQSLDVEDVLENETDVELTEEVLGDTAEVELNDIELEDLTDFEDADDVIAPVKTKSRVGLYVTLGILAAAIIALIAYLYFFKVVPAQPIKDLYNAQYAGDMTTYFDSLYPPNAPSAKENFYSMYEKDGDYLKEIKESLVETFGENYDISVSVLDVDHFTESMLETLKNELADGDKEKVTDAAYVSVKIKGVGDETTQVNVPTNNAIKYDGKWYIYD